MPMPTTVQRGNLLFDAIFGLTLSPASVAANSAAEQQFPFPGLLLGVDYVIGVSKPTVQAGLSLGNVRVVANNTIGIQFVNGSGSPIVPTAGEIYAIEVARFESAGLPLPNAIT